MTPVLGLTPARASVQSYPPARRLPGCAMKRNRTTDRLRVACGQKSSGAQGRDRTTDTVIFNHVLYQLSYLGAEPAERRAGRAPGL
jgi:hypothetical protein